ncbi:MAG TPA: tautomerase family protein [Burkholderiaceae bacterium]|jgi:phenylpyruvate tautomerase PptA (4-oxalocrotonate tautomerase family)|nr:tautomerase family protein [Burkholderiaceae bacterium]
MPLVRIDLARGKPVQYRKALGDIIYRAMTEVINVPQDDKFQIITEHAPEELNVTPGYLGIRYSPDVVLIQVTLSLGRTVEQKQAFYKRVATDLQRELKLDPQDVFINLVEVAKENWSFGNGIAQYVTPPGK